MEKRVFLKTLIGEKDQRLRVALIELCDIIWSGSNDEDRAAQSLAKPGSLRGRTNSVSGEISVEAASSALRVGERYL